MIKNNVKENLFDDEENIYVGLSDLVNLRESAELREPQTHLRAIW